MFRRLAAARLDCEKYGVRSDLIKLGPKLDASHRTDRVVDDFLCLLYCSEDENDFAVV